MAFFNKLGEMAKNIGDKTGDALEIAKLNSQIGAEKAAADAELRKIGACYYAMFAADGTIAPEAREYCVAAKGHYDAMAAAQAEIEKIKAENDVPKPAAAAGPESRCPACGTANAPGTRFCSACGAKLEEQKPAARTCPACGAAVAENIKFCSDCGQKMEG